MDLFCAHVLCNIMEKDSPPNQDDESNDQEEEITDYEDLVWLTKKSARSKLQEWRRDPPSKMEPPQVGKKEKIIKTCKTCYFCSHVKEFNDLLYVRCTIDEPKWVAVQYDLPCWKASE